VRASDPAVQTLVGQLPNGIVGLPVQRTPAADRSSTPLLFDPNLRTPFVHQWNFRIQRQILHDTVLEVAYVGSHGTHLFRMMNANQAVITPAFLDSFRSAQKGIRAGPVGALLDTYGATAASLPASITTNLSNSDVGAFITAVTTGVVNGVVGGRMTAAGLGLGYFNNPQFHHGRAGVYLHRQQLQRAADFVEPPLRLGIHVPKQLHLGEELGRRLRRHRRSGPNPPDSDRFQQPASGSGPQQFRYPASVPRRCSL